MADGTAQLMDMLDGSWDASSGGGGGSGKGWISRDEQERFLLSLLSLGLDRVAAEPERLANECHAVKKDTETHAVSNYSAFLQSAVCVRSVREELELSGRLLHELAADVPSLQRACEEVEEHAKAVDLLRKQTQTTWKMHAQLLEVLEVPQLMDTAVRNEYYEEALELAAFARRLRARHQENTLIESLFQAVERSENNMLYQLLQKLQSHIQLPVCLHVIGVLRRLGRHSEEDLRFIFLECRDLWLQSAFDEAEKSGPVYQSLSKITDLVRVHIFEIVTQYRAIFLDFSSSQEMEGSADGGLLYAWASRRITNFISVLNQGLPRIKECSQISSLLDKVMYCGAYLGREGLDFRSAVGEIFEMRMLEIIQLSLSNARDAYEQSLAAQKLNSMPEAVKTRYEENATGVMSPPSIFLNFIPLALLCNKLMDSLNELRECAMITCRQRATGMIVEVLCCCAEQTAANFAEIESSLSKGDRKHMVDLVS
ncbi:oligomeric Golgi complex component 8 [Guillardia theta CCMP2712]|uniref:Conserved oligomeric Golgi complex subunit 8 n=1 Tax=Guillardia theta (strain CCMP2712) TaxID=905079 RepID=L1IAE6_GUITC|nr:oligomeric Golgi complex component 8 [Guillardia theta CCMP2712]EKX32864.1 oligomeric Golgi complex component 8 [Guillardia theta CCMP2712]|eukprot:XP_005819844.1 oligomeric Golgi complex component 8 [Guillardia theta CCMP2712]